MRETCRLTHLLLAVVSMTLLVGCEREDVQGVHGRPKPHVPLGQGHDFGNSHQNLYLAMGDSITEGNKDPDIVPYPERLSEKLGKPVINAGDGGAWSGDGVDAVDGLLAEFLPGFVLLLYGANDIHPDHDPAETIANLDYMVKAAEANKAIPVVATITPFINGKRGYLAPYVPPLNDAIRNYATEEDLPLADLEAAFGGNPAYLKEDGLHPSDAGTEVIARTFYDVLK